MIMNYFLAAALLLCIANHVSAFHTPLRRATSVRPAGVKGLTAVLDVLAGMAIANQLNSAPMHRNFLSSSSMPVAVAVTQQGMYKEYTVDKIDDSALDQIKRSYKTAEETDDSKNKYWTILAVLVGGSFIIPMVQYYWYVAEED